MFLPKKQLQPNLLNKDPYWKKRPCTKFSRATWDPKRESQCPFKRDRPKNLILIRALCVCRRLGPAYFLGKNFNFRTHVSTCGAKNMPKIVPFKFSLKFSCCWPFEALQKKIAHRYFIFSRELQNGRPPNPLKPNNCLQILDKT